MKRALVVDDTKNIRTMLTTCLEINNYKVITANNGFEALELFNKENFDLVFLDIKMPELSGTEVLRRIREEGIKTPVVIMTAFATVKNAIECTKLGVVSYLQKPFTIDRIKNVLGEVFSKLDDEEGLYLERIKELISHEEYDNALELLKKALSIDPCYYEIYFLLGKVYEGKKDINKAESFYAVSEILKTRLK